ncbi:hypothetical protein BJ973_008048 [Actinoplanes tereljensis]|uniref:Uncharacterized protein n=1 Tax=Paractinoplanes tereljensis TaxID=571912 RepID=A0A919NV94_9ACTN|nr:hypothetical protein [Actinoplanes tereljensis]GIF24569.1 hypothetical protein Ate02nite_72990 [Actinoplanes tereljensis]
MKPGGKPLVIAVIAVALGAGGTAFAYAGGSWTVPGQAAMTAKVAGMPRGVVPSAAKQGDRAVISWSAQEIGDGVLMDHYVVTAHHVGEPQRPDITRKVAASGEATEVVTFGAAELVGGRWYWTIMPLYRGWTGAVSGRSQRLRFTAAPPADTADAPAAAPEPPMITTAPATTAPATEEPIVTTPETTPATTEPAEAPTPEETETTDS